MNTFVRPPLPFLNVVSFKNTVHCGIHFCTKTMTKCAISESTSAWLNEVAHCVNHRTQLVRNLLCVVILFAVTSTPTNASPSLGQEPILAGIPPFSFLVLFTCDALALSNIFSRHFPVGFDSWSPDRGGDGIVVVVLYLPWCMLGEVFESALHTLQTAHPEVS